MAQADRNLLTDLDDVGVEQRFMIRDRDGKFPHLFDTIVADAGIQVLLNGIQMPRMNSIMERRIQVCRHELLDRTLLSQPGDRLYRAPEADPPNVTRHLSHSY